MTPLPEVSLAPDRLARQRRHAEAIFMAAVDAVRPESCIARIADRRGELLTLGQTEVDLNEVDHLYLLGAGKASAAMAAAMEALLAERITAGRICVKYGHGAPLTHCSLFEAGHPVPDAAGVDAADAIRELARRAGERDLVICLISGGGSALLPLPRTGLTLADKQATTRLLLASGATIHEVNAIRKHLSAIKGGRLAQAAAPARVISLLLSDVVGDDLDVIASGPTVPDTSTYADCRAILERYQLTRRIPAAVRRLIDAGAAGDRPDTPKADDAAFRRVANIVVGSNLDALAAARKTAESLGYACLVLTSRLEGEARDAARFLTQVLTEVHHSGYPQAPPLCLLSAGETTVTLRGGGKGGRNTELALAAAGHLKGVPHCVLLSGGTDGNDGPTDAAGAIVDGQSATRVAAEGVDLDAALSNNDAYTALAAAGDLLITGPTRTNVMDLQIGLAGCPEETVRGGRVPSRSESGIHPPR
jgi:hydroxypyruvate reductase